MDLYAVTENISVVIGENRGRFPKSHAILIRGDRTALIDTGCGIGILKKVRDAFPIDLLVNSHSHPDHSAGNWLFPAIPLYGPIQSAATHGRISPLSERFTEPGALARSWVRFVASVLDFRDRPPTHFFGEGDRFDFGGLALQAVHTPGHTIDHYCFWEPDRRILFGFDLDLTPFGPWYGHRESDLADLRHSIRRMRDLNPEIVVSSHREVIRENIREEIDRFEGVLARREQTLLALLTKPAALEDLVRARPFYGRYPYAPDLLEYWEGRMIEKHLAELCVRGAVRRMPDGYRAV